MTLWHKSHWEYNVILVVLALLNGDEVTWRLGNMGRSGALARSSCRAFLLLFRNRVSKAASTVTVDKTKHDRIVASLMLPGKVPVVGSKSEYLRLP